MKIFNDSFSEFYESVPLKMHSFDELISDISKSIVPLADDIGLGKIGIQFKTQASFYEPKGKSGFCVLYSNPNGFDDSVKVSDSFPITESGSIAFTSYPCTGTKWNESDSRQISVMHKQLYFLCCHVRMINILQKTSTTDLLTGISNTNGFSIFANNLVKKNELCNYTILFINLKNFKFVNQNFGASAGDEALRKYAVRVSRLLDSDEILARLGGDNFVCLVKKENEEKLLRTLSSFRVNISIDDIVHSVDIASRIGIYHIKENDNFSDAMNRSSVAINVAKKSVHHDHIIFQEVMIERSEHIKKISGMFQSALENHEYITYYQPKVSLDSMQLCGSEALVRWKHQGTIVQPGDFIPVLEQNGNICVLDFYILETVCQDIRRWIEAGIEPVRVSVNFSKIHLHNRSLAKDVLSVLDKYHIDHKYIEIELTETSAYDDFDTLCSFVSTLRQNGVYTSIDDFGTGYSSLNLLKNLPVNVIKLDKSFLDGITGSDKDDTIIIKAMIDMANALKMEVICEGIETKAQASLLKELGCSKIQGFWFDRPLPVQDYEKRLENKQYEVTLL